MTAGKFLLKNSDKDVITSLQYRFSGIYIEIF